MAGFGHRSASVTDLGPQRTEKAADYDTTTSYVMNIYNSVDAEYKFLYMDVSAIGSESDGGVFAKTQLCKMLDRHEANLPAPERLPNETEDKPPVDYFFVGDDAFALKKYITKPYPARSLTIPERIYNYRLSRIQSVSHPIKLRQNRVESVVLAVCVLDNLIMTKNPHARSEGDEENSGET
ncbi:uncharacterized protein [Macrobrachium rosenbergii]|uniref:uncharacterized protein n=1 Tax=Macrobrachium rosenbergii TaxID=79674 RepID=UPI0034D621BC